MRLKSALVAICSLGLLATVASAQEQAPPDNAGKTRMHMPTGGRMGMRHHRHRMMHHRMMHRKMMHKKMM